MTTTPIATLSAIQQQVLNAALQLASPSTHAASGHDIREHLQNAGLNKKVIAVTLGELVSMQRLERVKITEPTGLFYTAYRRVSLPD